MAQSEVEMTFAEKQLAKYGWKKGMGLGKKNDGISEPIRVKAQNKKLGFGNDPKKKLAHWWDLAYNRAANNIVVVRSENGDIEVKSSDECSISKEKPNLFNTNVLYDDFEQAGTLKRIQFTSDKPEAEVESPGTHGLLLDMSDAELLKLCGGGTAHKGARHGIRMGGKLKRIKEMDEAYARQRQAEQKKLLETEEKNNNLEDEKYNGQDSQPRFDNDPGNDLETSADVDGVACSGADTSVSKKKNKKSKRDKKKDDYSQIESLPSTKHNSPVVFDKGSDTSHEFSSHESNCKTTKNKRKRKDTVDEPVDEEERSVESPVIADLEKKKKKKRKHREEVSLDGEETSQQIIARDCTDLEKKKKRKKSKCREDETKDELKENIKVKNKERCESAEDNITPAISEVDKTSDDIRRKKKKHKKKDV